jgi:hypothetical protein
MALAFLALAACGPRDTRPDSEKFSQFHTDVAAIDRRVTTVSDAYTSQSNAALDHGDRAALDAAAARLRSALAAIRPDAAALKAPEFASPAARDNAQQVLAAMLEAIGANEDAAAAVGRIADPHHPTNVEIAAIQDARDRVSAAGVAESNAMFSLRGEVEPQSAPGQ